DQQHNRILGADRLEEWTGEQEVLSEDVLLDVGPRCLLVLVALDLDAQELLLVVPLVERLGLVEALVALQPDEAAAGQLGDRLGQLGLAGAGRALDEHRLLQPVGQVDDPGDALVGQVPHRRQALAHCGNRFEAGLGIGDGHVRICPSPWMTYFVVVSSRRPMGPRACSFCVLIPISAPKPNSSPSVKRVDALTITAAASTSRSKRRAASRSVVQIASVWPVP